MGSGGQSNFSSSRLGWERCIAASTILPRTLSLENNKARKRITAEMQNASLKRRKLEVAGVNAKEKVKEKVKEKAKEKAKLDWARARVERKRLEKLKAERLKNEGRTKIERSKTGKEKVKAEKEKVK